MENQWNAILMKLILDGIREKLANNIQLTDQQAELWGHYKRYTEDSIND